MTKATREVSLGELWFGKPLAKDAFRVWAAGSLHLAVIGLAVVWVFPVDTLEILGWTLRFWGLTVVFWPPAIDLLALSVLYVGIPVFCLRELATRATPLTGWVLVWHLVVAASLGIPILVG